MARILPANAETPKTIARAVAEKETFAFADAAKRIRKSKRGNYRDISLKSTPTLPGDRTDNTPTLRRETKQRNENQANLPQRPYLLSAGGRCHAVNADGSEDKVNSLKILGHYRHIMASGKDEREQ